MRLIALTVPAALLLATGAFVGAACQATPSQVSTTINDGISLAGCVLSKVLSGVVDVLSLLGCAGATEALIVDIIDDFQAQHVGDAGLAAVGSSLTTQQVQWLATARSNAIAALAAKEKAK